MPTKGAGKYTGGLFVGKFIKTLSFQRMTKESTKEVGAAAALVDFTDGAEVGTAGVAAALIDGTDTEGAKVDAAAAAAGVPSSRFSPSAFIMSI